MQLFIPQNSNPKRREKVVTNFSVLQKRLRLRLRVPNSDVMFAIIKRFGTACCIILRESATLCNKQDNQT